MTTRKNPETPRGTGPPRELHPASHSQDRSQTTTTTTTKEASMVMFDKKDKTSSTKENQSTQQTPSIGRSALRSARRHAMFGKTPGRSVRATSYKTPRLGTVPWQRIAARTSVKKRDEKLWKNHRGELLNRSMKVCNLSSMTNFKFKDEKLRAKYEKTLKNKVLDMFPSPRVVVKFTLTPCFSWESSVEAVWIKVKSLVPGDTEDKDRMVVVYDAWLVLSHHVQSTKMKNVQWLPVMLYTGRESVHQVVVDWLQSSFECYVARCGMKQSELLWMTGICSRLRCRNSSHDSQDCNIEFNYLLIPPPGRSSFSPPNDKHRPNVVVQLSLQEVHQMWDRLVDRSSSEVGIEDLQKFMLSIDSLTSSASGLPSSLLRLLQVRTPCVSISSSGKVRLMCQHSIALVTQCFKDVFIQMATSYDPDDYLEESEKEDSIAELNNNYQ